MRQMILGNFSIGVCLLAFPLVANATANDYYSITRTETTELGGASISEPVSAPAASPEGAVGGIGLSLDPGALIVGIGTLAWTVIKDNSPTATATMGTGSAVPKGAKGWEDLVGWKTPVSRVFTQEFFNMFNGRVITFQYSVNYTYGGKFEGKGEYLTDIGVESKSLQVNPGFHFDVKASVPEVLNVGTTSEPVAEAKIHLEMTANSVMGLQQITKDFEIRGDGQFTQEP